ncbi:MAG: HAMP domain-containing protein [Theionarchaea archaeon]|nr:HAMP domain-containing protein [Theionarchaea archaeon]
MNLRKKTLIIIGITLAGLVVILYSISQVIVMGSFAELEEENTCQNVERVLRSLSNDLAMMSSTANDWASWDDTYSFIEDRNLDYIEGNLMDGTFINLRLNIMMYIHSSGELVFDKAVNLQDGSEIPFPKSLEDHISTNDFLLRHGDLQSSKIGILLLPEGPLLLTSRPILTSNGEGPARGTLIIGRFLTSEELKRLEEITQIPFSLVSISDPLMPPDSKEALSLLSDTVPMLVEPLSEDTISGYTLIKDVYGKPILVLRVDIPRDIYREGKASMRYFLVSFLAGGLVVIGVIFLLLETLILSPLTSLSGSVSTIAKSDDLSKRVSVTGKDELSNLALEINRMIETIEQSSKKLQYSLKEKEILLREIHHRVKNNMQIILSLLGLQSAYIDDDKMSDVFKQSHDRIKTMALIHEKLYQSENLVNIDFRQYVETLVYGLFQSYGKRKITLEIDVDDTSPGMDIAIPCGLIINELVTNALKHAFPDGEGKIKVVFRKVGEKMHLLISDNGVGIPDTIDFRNTKSLGLQLVTLLAEEQLRGSIELKRANGTEFRIIF